MRVRAWIVIVALMGSVALALPAGAEEEVGEAKRDVSADSLAILRARLEALIRKAALLEKQGDYAAALRVYSEVEEVYEQVIADLRRLTDGRNKPSATPKATPGSSGKSDIAPTPSMPKTLPHPRPGGFELEESPGAFMGRGGNRDMNSPGGKKRADAVMDALLWLKAHQSPNGSWEAAGFPSWCDGKPNNRVDRRPDGVGKAMYDPGVTGLALCAYLGAGYTNRGRHPFAKTVSKGLRYLKNIQDPEGCFGPRASPQFIYNHATASLAMIEAYGMTASPIFKGAAQRALDFHGLSRNPYYAWRYGVKPGDNDTSVTAWMFMGTRSGLMINAAHRARDKPEPLSIDTSAVDGVRAWIEKMTDGDYGRVGYIQRGTGPARPRELVDRFPGEKSESMTAAGILMRIMSGEDPRKSMPIKLGARLIQKLPPVWNPADGSIDMYYWYFGTLAAFQIGGKTWKVWSQGMQNAIVPNQRKDTDYCGYKGSWDPIGPWCIDGGRVYSTALMAMCLQVYYRYDRVFGVHSGGSAGVGWQPK